MKRIRNWSGLLLGFLSLFLYIAEYLGNQNILGTQHAPASTPTQTPTPTVIQTVIDDGNTTLVERVIDGDTIEISGGVRLRYIGIDTPESVDPRQPVQCFSKEATEANKRLVLGKSVRLEKDVSETDRFGRILRYVYVDDVMVNEELVRNGFAQAITYPPDVKYQEKLSDAEEEARNGLLGLWGSCVTTPTP